MFLTIDGVGSLATENGLQMPRFYPHLVELKPSFGSSTTSIFLPVLSSLSGIETNGILAFLNEIGNMCYVLSSLSGIETNSPLTSGSVGLTFYPYLVELKHRNRI